MFFISKNQINWIHVLNSIPRKWHQAPPRISLRFRPFSIFRKISKESIPFAESSSRSVLGGTLLIILLLAGVLYWIITLPAHSQSLRRVLKEDKSDLPSYDTQPWFEAPFTHRKEPNEWCEGGWYENMTEDLLEVAGPLAPPVIYVEDLPVLVPECANQVPLEFIADTDTEENFARDLICSIRDQRERMSAHRLFKPVTIGVATQMHKITYVNISAGSWGLILTNWFTWTDERLLYDGSSGCKSWSSQIDFVQVPVDRMATSRIWAPDIINLNSVDPEIWASSMGQMEEARIYDRHFFANHGFNVAWKTTTTVHAVCDYEFRLFPFDQQVCSVILSPMSHRSDYVRLIPRKWLLANESLDSSTYHENDSTFLFEEVGSSNGIKILGWKMTLRNSKAPLSVPRKLLLDEDVPIIELVIHFERESSFFTLNFALPLAVMWLLAYSTFFLPFEEHDRLGIITAVVWTSTAIMFLTAEYKPANFLDTWGDVFQAGSLILCIFPAIEAVFVSRLKTHIQDQIRKTKDRYERERRDLKHQMRQIHLQQLKQKFMSSYNEQNSSCVLRSVGVNCTKGDGDVVCRLRSTDMELSSPETLLACLPDQPSTNLNLDTSQLYDNLASLKINSTSPLFSSTMSKSPLNTNSPPFSTPPLISTMMNNAPVYKTMSSTSTKESEVDEYDLLIAPPPKEVDPGIPSHMIDRIMQVTWPGILLAFAVNQLGPLSEDRSSTYPGPATLLMMVLILVMFCSLWLVAIVSYAAKLLSKDDE